MLKVEGAEVRALCDVESANLDKASEMVQAAGQKAPATTNSWAELLARDDIQGVVSALPCHLHHQNYLDVIASGKDLYAEKPMCLNAKECQEVVDAANGSSSIVQLGFQRRADPRFIETMGQIWAGELGTLVEGRIAWSNSWGPLYGWFGKKELSGDWMVEQAVHNWDVMNWANQCRPVRAMGMGRGGLWGEEQADRNVTDYYSAIVEFENGVIVNILHSWIAPGQSGAMKPVFNYEYTKLLGTRAGIDFNSGTFSYRKELGIADRVGHNYTGEIDSTYLALEAFADSVATRKPPISTVEHGRDSVLACLLVREAVRRGGVVTMEEVIEKGL
jgi:predicted dehydrogenase